MMWFVLASFLFHKPLLDINHLTIHVNMEEKNVYDLPLKYKTSQ